MSVLKQLKLEQRAIAHHRQLVTDLDGLVNSIERCESSINNLKTELEAVNAKFRERTTTEEDIAYLTALLKCAREKLNWEKQMLSLQKRTPVTLEKLKRLLDDAQFPPSDEMRTSLMQSLQSVQEAMQRLEKSKVE